MGTVRALSVTNMAMFHLLLLRLVSLRFEEFVPNLTKVCLYYRKDCLVRQLVMLKTLLFFSMVVDEQNFTTFQNSQNRQAGLAPEYKDQNQDTISLQIKACIAKRGCKRIVQA